MALLLRAHVLTPARLQAAWQATLARQPRPGPDGVSTEHFALSSGPRLAQLHADLLADRYRPGGAWRSWIAKASGGERAVIALGVQDRIVEGALLAGMRLVVETHLHPAAFAYREGLGALRAVSELLRRRSEGLTWVVRGDVSACFDSIPHLPLVDSLGLILAPCAQLTVYRTLNRPVVDRGRHGTLTRGVPQGGLLSPLLANWYLRPFDERISRHGAALVRYADDFVIAVGSPVQATTLLSEAQVALNTLQLNLNLSKTRVVSFAEGFDFLGFRIGDRGVRVSTDRLLAFREQMTTLLGHPEGPNLQGANDLLRGWRAYFIIGQVREDFEQLEHWLQSSFPACWPHLTRLIPTGPRPAASSPTAVLGGYSRPLRRQAQVRRVEGVSAPPRPSALVGASAITPIVFHPVRVLQEVRARLIVHAWATHAGPPARAAALLAQRLLEGAFADWNGLTVAVQAANRRLCGPSGDLAAGVARTHLYRVVSAAAGLCGLQDGPVLEALSAVVCTALIDLALADLITCPGPLTASLDAALQRPLEGHALLTWTLLLHRESRALARSLQAGTPYQWRQP